MNLFSEKPGLSIVIPTHNRIVNLQRLIQSIFTQEFSIGFIEVLVVSNVQDDPLENFINSLEFKNNPQVKLKLIVAGALSVNKARNIGLQQSSSHLVYFLDDDILLPHSEHIKNLVKAQETLPQAVAIGGGYQSPTKASQLEKYYCLMSCQFLNLNSDQYHATPFLLGGNTLYNKKILPNHFFFNEDIFFGGTETEFNLRLYNLDLSLYFLSNLSVIHDSSLNLKTFVKKAYLQGKGRFTIENLIQEKLIYVVRNDERLKQLQLNLWQKLYLEIYNFSFHVGYRNQKVHTLKNIKLNFSLTFLNFLKTFFQIETNETLNLDVRSSNAFHLKKIPRLKFNELYHWSKARIWWKIRYFFIWIIRVYILWRIIPFLTYIIIGIFWTIGPFEIYSVNYKLLSLAKSLEKKLKKLF